MKLKGVLLVGCTMMGVLLTKLPMRSFDKTVAYTAEAAEKPVSNPLKGWAPWIDDKEMRYPHTLVYVRMHWSDIEPEEGNYRFEELEKELHMDFWRERNVRFVIRIVCDTPSSEKEKNIPQWLYDKTYGDGTWYSGDYGKGYSPNYANPVFIEEHRQLVEAFAAYYGKDPALGFVQLGSLGHWGEWHVDSGAGIAPFPKRAIYNQYVQAYLDVFPASKLLVRRPLDIATEAGMGMFNDSFGVTRSHERWLSWIADGYTSEQSREAISGAPEFWKTAPSAGEFSTNYEKQYYFSDGYEETLRLLRASHTTFIGPRSGADVYETEVAEQILAMSSELGYCFRLGECRWTKKPWNPHYLLTLSLENIGVAPFYENWPLTVRIINENNETVYEEEHDISLPELLPGQHTVKIVIENQSLATGKYTVEIGIKDPLTGEFGIAFANEAVRENCYKVMEFCIEK